ncbi:MAG: phospho-N-acetylmuramoyl-pentapeptide-transferase [Clostridiaceae bacterium]|jgi:phospho-N-acetylmuramoyl-pentapeptide-transferase|nr:MAG: phospho-N-acetylmuramoyl-pentapeptide-transferase [Clostridiaceae bacterium]
MLILAKSVLGLMLGFVLSLVAAVILIPLLKKLHVGQSVSKLINERHLKKDGTPTIGGLIFIIPTILIMLILYLRGSIEFNSNLIILIFVFLAYGALGFIDDFLKVKYHNNNGLSIGVKFLLQTAIAVVFYIIYRNNGGDSNLVISSLGINVSLGWAFGLFILLVLVGTTNAVNISDGLDGLAGGLSVVAIMAYGVIAWGSKWISGYQEIAIFAFVLCGAILGFLVFNTHPAKVFMGDTGSLALGGALATIAILTKHELSLLLIGGVFVVETLSSAIQIIAIRKFHKKVFLKAPLHHHFEELGWEETDIVKLFWVVGLFLAMIGIIYGVWL